MKFLRDQNNQRWDIEQIVAICLLLFWCLIWQCTYLLLSRSALSIRLLSETHVTQATKIMHMVFLAATALLFVFDLITKQYSAMLYSLFQNISFKYQSDLSSKGEEAQVESTNPFGLALAIHLIGGCIAWLLAVFIPSSVAINTTTATKVLLLWSFIGLFLLFMAIFIRYQPHIHRSVAYGYLFAGVAMNWAGSSALYNSSLNLIDSSYLGFMGSYVRFFPELGPVETLYDYTLFNKVPKLYIPMFCSMTFLVVALVYDAVCSRQRGNINDREITYGLRRAFRVVTFVGRILLVGGMFAIYWDVVCIYLAVRYYVIGRMEETPILYIRSFKSKDAPFALSKIVLRVARDYGVVVALTHKSQPPKSLHKSSRIGEQARLSLSTDEAWQDWILSHIHRSTAVIADLSIETESLKWEIDQARAVLGPDRVIIMQQSDYEAAPHVSGDCTPIKYAFDRKCIRLAKRELHQRLQNILG